MQPLRAWATLRLAPIRRSAGSSSAGSSGQAAGLPPGIPSRLRRKHRRSGYNSSLAYRAWHLPHSIFVLPALGKQARPWAQLVLALTRPVFASGIPPPKSEPAASRGHFREVPRYRQGRLTPLSHPPYKHSEVKHKHRRLDSASLPVAFKFSYLTPRAWTAPPAIGAHSPRHRSESNLCCMASIHTALNGPFRTDVTFDDRHAPQGE